MPAPVSTSGCCPFNSMLQSYLHLSPLFAWLSWWRPVNLLPPDSKHAAVGIDVLARLGCIERFADRPGIQILLVLLIVSEWGVVIEGDHDASGTPSRSEVDGRPTRNLGAYSS